MKPPIFDDTPTADDLESFRQAFGIHGAGLADEDIARVIALRGDNAKIAWLTERACSTGGIAEAYGKRWVLLHRTGPTTDGAGAGDTFIAIAADAEPLPAPCFAIVVPRGKAA